MKARMTGDFLLLRRLAALFCAWSALVLMIPTTASAQASGSTTFSATVEAAVVPKLGLVEAESLNFGTMASGPNGGTVIVSPLGVRSLGAASTVVLAGGTVSAAKFDGYGNRNQFIRVTIQPTTLLTRAGAPAIPAPLDLMIVDQLTLGITATSGLAQVGAGNGLGTRYRISRANGLFDFRVGGRLAVKPLQTGGNYSGTYTVTAIYN